MRFKRAPPLFRNHVMLFYHGDGEKARQFASLPASEPQKSPGKRAEFIRQLKQRDFAVFHMQDSRFRGARIHPCLEYRKTERTYGEKPV